MHRLLISIALLAACKGKPKDPPKLKKMDFKVAVDERGRMLPEIELFDQHHAPIAVIGAYTLTLARPDGTMLCSLARPLAKEDYAKDRLKAIDWQDASCPPDPSAEELRVTLEVKMGETPDAPKLSRDKTTPTKFIYRHLKVPAAAGAGSSAGAGSNAGSGAGSGSSAGSGDAKTVAPVEKADGSGSAK